MKTTLHIIIFFTCTQFLFAQGIKILSGTSVVTNNTTQIVLGGNANWINNGTVNLTTSGTSTMVMKGNALQNIGGTSASTFKNFTLNNSSSGAFLSNNISIIGTLQMTDGDFDLRNQNIDLSTTGLVNGESEANRIKATNGVADGEGSGTIYSVKTINTGVNSNISGLGISINPTSNFGLTTITRGHLKQQGSGSFTGNYSIFRYYSISPASAAVASVDFSYFPGVELNGHTDGQLEMFQWVQVGTPTFWKPLTSVNSTPSLSADILLNTLTDYKITAGSTSKPLPVELVNFTATCINGKNLLLWQTASETNSSEFILERSTDNYIWQPVATITASLNSNTLKSYSFTDNEIISDIKYYRLKETDIDGSYFYSSVISSDCATIKSENANIAIYFDSEINIQVNVSEPSSFNLIFIDALGRILYLKKINISTNTTLIKESLEQFAPGVYQLVLQNKQTFISKKIIIPQ